MSSDRPAAWVRLAPVAVLALLLAACSGGGVGGETSAPTEDSVAEPTQDDADETDSEAATYKFGVVAPLSGGAADYGNAFVNGIRLAVDDINEAGGIEVGGQQVTLEPVTCDDQFESDTAVNCARRLVSQEQVNVVQTPSSLAAFPMMGFNEDEGFIIMATSQSPDFTTQGNDLVVRYVNNTDRTMGPFVDVLRQFSEERGLGINSVGIMEVNTELGQSWVENFSDAWEKSGGEVVAKATYDANDTDFYSQLSTIVPEDPDAIVLTTVCQPSATVIQQARELGYEGHFVNSAACSGEELVNIIPDLADGVMFESSTWAFPDDAVTDLKSRYTERFDADPQFITGVGYEGVQWLAEALKEAGTTEDVQQIRSAFPGALDSLDSMFDMSNADETGDLDFPMYVGYIEDGEVQGYRGQN